MSLNPIASSYASSPPLFVSGPQGGVVPANGSDSQSIAATLQLAIAPPDPGDARDGAGADSSLPAQH